MAKETKYFMTGTDEEVLMGDVIEVTMEKELKGDRKITRKMEFELNEDTLEDALEMGIIEEKEEDNLIEFQQDDVQEEEEWEDAVNEDLDNHEDRIVELEDLVTAFQKKVEALEKIITSLQNSTKKETASSKKK
jgi:hypothetical protein